MEVSDGHYLNPYRLYALEHNLLLGTEQSEKLKRFPRDFLKLANALIDLQDPPLPRDLGKFLDNCLKADSIVADSACLRFGAYRKRQHSQGHWKIKSPGLRENPVPRNGSALRFVLLFDS